MPPVQEVAPARLVFSATRGGRAVLHGRCVLLVTPPILPGCDIDVAEIDYMPHLRACTIRERHGGWRDMTAAEIAAADRFLWRRCLGTDPPPTNAHLHDPCQPS